ncbi:hypothetical protein ACTGU5_03585 [Streptococcus suis]
MKPFKDLDEQITILKGRGLNFHDEDEAKRYITAFGSELLHYRKNCIQSE